MIITPRLQELIKFQIIGKAGVSDKRTLTSRINRLEKIFSTKWAKKNPSLYVKRLKGKVLTEKQGRELLDWFGDLPIDFKKKDYDTRATGYMHKVQKSFIVEYRLINIYFDAQLNNIEFDERKRNKNVIIDEVIKVNHRKSIGC